MTGRLIGSETRHSATSSIRLARCRTVVSAIMRVLAGSGWRCPRCKLHRRDSSIRASVPVSTPPSPLVMFFVA
jgi:hypothetical protein